MYHGIQVIASYEVETMILCLRTLDVSRSGRGLSILMSDTIDADIQYCCRPQVIELFVSLFSSYGNFEVTLPEFGGYTINTRRELNQPVNQT